VPAVAFPPLGGLGYELGDSFPVLLRVHAEVGNVRTVLPTSLHAEGERALMSAMGEQPVVLCRVVPCSVLVEGQG
jgi:hypothetical protein